MLRSVILGLFLPGLLCAQTDWPVYGHDPGGARYSPLRQVDTASVNRLRRAWTYHTGEQTETAAEARGQRFTAFETTPLVIGNILYLSTPAGRIIALDAETGREEWKFDPQARRGGPPRYHAHRGVAYWPGDARTPARIFFGTQDGRLMALSAATGRPIPGFGKEGEIDLRKDTAGSFPGAVYSITSPPTIYRNLVITGAEVPEWPGSGPSGDVRAFDARSGELAWRFHTVPQPGEPGHESWEGDSWRDRTGVNVWSIITVDAVRGIIYLPIGSPAYDFYGGDRAGRNLYGNCLVALDAATGKLLWFYQFVHHDVWDYDPPAPPALITARGVPAVVQITKMGLVFVLNRLTGAPLYPVEERPVPQSAVRGESTWPTQPFPLQPPPISRDRVASDEITTVTPESHRYCADLFAQLVSRGRYTPYGLQLTLVFPGTLGGGTWSGAAFDPQLGYLFVNANEIGAVGRLAAQPDGSPTRYRRTSPEGEYARFWDTHHWPCQQPPWGTLNAINANTGEIAWRVPLGITEELEAIGVHHTGAPNIGGSIATAGGLVFIAATNDARFRAFDSRTGSELWTAKLEASGFATPITYLGKNRKQYVVIAAGGGGFFNSNASDTLAAFSLP